MQRNMHRFFFLQEEKVALQQTEIFSQSLTEKRKKKENKFIIAFVWVQHFLPALRWIISFVGFPLYFVQSIAAACLCILFVWFRYGSSIWSFLVFIHLSPFSHFKIVIFTRNPLLAGWLTDRLIWCMQKKYNWL